MSEEYRDPVRELEDQMRAANDLIEALEGEVADLRRDLERAGGALRAAREEVVARGKALEELEESERLRTAAEEEARGLWSELNELRQQSADEQLRLRNKHIADMAALRKELEEQRRADIEAAEAGGKIGTLREEFRKERTALEARHKNEVAELKRAAQRWEEKLRGGYQRLEERHKNEIEEIRKSHSEEVEALKEEHRAEVEALQKKLHDETESMRGEVEGQKIEFVRTIQEEKRRVREGELRAQRERHAEELQALRSAAAVRELELQKELRSAAESHRIEVEQLRLELESSIAAAEERRRSEIKDIKSLAERRERELRQTHASRLAEEKEAAEKRITTLKAQREADGISFKEQHAKEMEKVRQDLEKRLVASQERHRSEVSDLEERLEDLKARQQPERPGIADEQPAEDDTRRWLAEVQESTDHEDHTTRIWEEPESEPLVASESPATRDEDRLNVAYDDQRLEAEEASDGFEDRLGEGDTKRYPADRQGDPEREEAYEDSSGCVLDPERHLWDGISLFNQSEHTRTVASISKSLGLPEVYVGLDKEDPSGSAKPIITFVWSDLAWHRYVSDPTQRPSSARVYLTESGDDRSDDLRHPDHKSNARMDAKGRVIFGLPAW